MPLVLWVEGLPGSGKSTLCVYLAAALEARGLRVVITHEPVNLLVDSGLLDDFYADKASVGLRVELTMLRGRADLQRRAVPDGMDVLIDRKSTRLNSSHIPLSRMPSSA